MPETNEAPLPDQIRAALQDLLPELIEIDDQSAAHAGHAGARSGAHFGLLLVSAAFSGQNRLQRHRMVNERLRHLLQGRIHALTMRLLAPDEKR
jgi:BolA protein